MGFALAAEALRRGARVTLISGPSRVNPPLVQELVRVRSAAEMHQAVMARAGAADVVIMAAAVADYTPAVSRADKMPKGKGPLSVELVRTADILADLGQLPSRATGRPVLVGFAAETGDAVTKARTKRARKQVDLVVANDISQPGIGFDTDTNAVTIVGEVDADDQQVPLQSKQAVAAAILDRAARLVEARGIRRRESQ
jgi:phosphopantothenoylcysteine decarboxylase/phosphopantothenate--cysteine ligase